MKRKKALIILIALTAIMAVWVIKSAVHVTLAWKMKRYRDDLIHEKKTLQIENNRLKTVLKEMEESNDIRERLIYMKLGLKKPGDIIIIIPVEPPKKNLK